nr:Flp family type IVb pilin [Roseibium sp.]
MRWTARRLCRDESGATAIEYGLIAGLLAVVLIASMSVVGTTIRDGYFKSVTTAMQDAMTSAGY